MWSIGKTAPKKRSREYQAPGEYPNSLSRECNTNLIFPLSYPKGGALSDGSYVPIGWLKSSDYPE